MASEFNTGIGERDVALENIVKPEKGLSVSPEFLFADSSKPLRPAGIEDVGAVTVDFRLLVVEKRSTSLANEAKNPALRALRGRNRDCHETPPALTPL